VLHDGSGGRRPTDSGLLEQLSLRSQFREQEFDLLLLLIELGF
jgi:hypothetical protein